MPTLAVVSMINQSLLFLVRPVKVVDESGDAVSCQEGYHGYGDACSGRDQEHLVPEVVPAEHDAGNPAKRKAHADNMLDKFQVDDKCVDHVTSGFCADTFQSKAAIQTGCKEATGDPDAGEKDAGIDAVTSEEVYVGVYPLCANSKKERREKAGKVYRTSASDNGNSDFLKHVWSPRLTGIFQAILKDDLFSLFK